jgi:AraC family transcriptional regulator of arabinose operon
VSWTDRLNQGPHTIALGEAGAEVLHWAYSPHLEDNAPHHHTYFEICQVGRWGQGTFFVEGRPHLLRPGDLFIARPSVTHQIVNAQRPLMELYWVSFRWLPPGRGEPGEIARLQQLFSTSDVLVASEERAQTARLWAALVELAQRPNRIGYGAQAQALIAALLLAIAQAGSEPQAAISAEPPCVDAGEVAVRVALRYIHDNLSRPLALPEIAAQAGVSPRHLARLFARCVGMSPAVYIAQTRIERARGLLRQDNLPIKAVAEKVGVPDVHYFTRLFSRLTGCPPGQYRQQREQADVPKIQNPGALV